MMDDYEVWEPTIIGNYLYCITGEDREVLAILDISSPGQPKLVKEVEGAFYDVVCVTSNSQYICCLTDNGGISLIDISDPLNADCVGSFYDEYEISQIVLSKDSKYLYGRRTGSSEFYVLSLDPSNPNPVQLIGDYYYVAMGDIDSMFLGPTGRYLYIGTFYGLFVVDISKPDAPDTVRKIGLVGDPFDFLYTSNSRLYANAGHNDIMTFDVTDPPNTKWINTIRGIYRPYTISFDNNYTYIGDEWGVAAVNITDLESAYVTSQVFINADWSNGAIEEGNSIIAFSNGKQGNMSKALSVVAPGWPKYESDLHPGNETDGVIVDNYAYLMFGAGFSVYDISNPKSCQHLGVSYTQNSFNHIRYKDGYILSDGNTFYTIDVHDVTQPKIVSSINADDENEYQTWFDDIAVAGNYAYLIREAQDVLDRTLDIFDISSVASPHMVGSMDLGSEGITISYVAGITFMPEKPTGSALSIFTIRLPPQFRRLLKRIANRARCRESICMAPAMRAWRFGNCGRAAFFI